MNTEATDRKITVSIVEDDRETRESLRALLHGQDGLVCLSVYADGESALAGVPKVRPEVVLMDINLPKIGGVECVARLKELMPELHILMLTTYEDGGVIFDSLRAGAKGYLLKNMPPAELVQAVKQVHAGGAPMSMRVARKVVDYFEKARRSASEVDSLSKREREILTLLAKGLLYKEIADQLSISSGTVRTHLQRIYEKLHVQSRSAAMLKFLNGN